MNKSHGLKQRKLFKYDLELPTESQWEYAARGKWTNAEETPSSNAVFWTGNTVASLQGTLNIADMGGRRLGSPESWRFEATLDDGHMVHAPIGSFTPNPFGLHDMLGNVWEWCSDRFGAYTLPTESGTGRRIVSKEDARTYLEAVAFVHLLFTFGVQIDTLSMRRITVPMM